MTEQLHESYGFTTNGTFTSTISIGTDDDYSPYFYFDDNNISVVCASGSPVNDISKRGDFTVVESAEGFCILDKDGGEICKDDTIQKLEYKVKLMSRAIRASRRALAKETESL